MKKTQVALAALALLASTAALADGVKVSGIIDYGIQNYSGSGTAQTGKGTSFEQGGWSDHSSITFSGSEDLGSGMKAFFSLESGFTQNGDPGNGGNGTLFSRESKVGLSGDFGTVTLGQQLSPYILAHAVTQAGTAGHFWVNRIIMGGGLGAAGVGAGTGAFQKGGFFIANAVSYTTPSIGGWTATILTNTKNGAKDGAMAATTSDGDKYTAYNVSGSVAGVNIAAGYQNRQNTYTSWVAGGTYGIGDLTIGANISSHKPEGGDAVGAYLISANYALGNGTSVVGGVARNDLDAAQSLTNIGLKHDLSKRTFVYLTHNRGTNGAISSLAERGNYAATGRDNNNTVVGVSHSF